MKYYPEIELCVKEQKGEQEAKAREAQRLADENFGTSFWGRLRTNLWNVMEYPETSRTAQVVFTFSFFFGRPVCKSAKFNTELHKIVAII